MKALIVSSDRFIHEIMLGVLESRGCTVDEAFSTEKARYFIKTREYDVMVLPDSCDGRFGISDIASQLRGLAKAKRTQVILIETSPKLSNIMSRSLGNKVVLKIPKLKLETFPFDEVLK